MKPRSGITQSVTALSSISSASFCSWKPLAPPAYNAATTLPALVPTTMSGTIPWASSALMTPMCANPRAAPPPRTRASLPPEGGAAGLPAKSAHADSRARSAIRVARSMDVDRAMVEGNAPALAESRPEAGIVADSPPVSAPGRGHLFRPRAIRTSSLRGIGFGPNNFAIEAFLDEFAVMHGIDPVELRLRLQLLKNTPHGQVVVNLDSRWSTKPEGCIRWIIFIPYRGSIAAEIDFAWY